MKYGSITSRRCARCLTLGTGQLANGICVKCYEWQKKNPEKKIKLPVVVKPRVS